MNKNVIINVKNTPQLYSQIDHNFIILIVYILLLNLFDCGIFMKQEIKNGLKAVHILQQHIYLRFKQKLSFHRDIHTG